MNTVDQEWADDDKGEYSSKTYIIDGGYIYCEIIKEGDEWACSASIQCDRNVRLDSEKNDLDEAKKRLECYVDEWFMGF